MGCCSGEGQEGDKGGKGRRVLPQGIPGPPGTKQLMLCLEGNFHQGSSPERDKARVGAGAYLHLLRAHVSMAVIL